MVVGCPNSVFVLISGVDGLLIIDLSIRSRCDALIYSVCHHHVLTFHHQESL